MKIRSITYKQFKGLDNEWSVKDFELGKINLIVGKNGSGKSKTISLIHSLSVILGDLNKIPFIEGAYDVTFQDIDSNDIFYYKLEYSDAIIINEVLKKNKEFLVKRNYKGIGVIKSNKAGNIDFKIPSDEIVLNRRDEIQYPYLERFNYWAKHLRRFLFNTPMGKSNLGVYDKLGLKEIDYNFKETEKTIDAFRKGLRNHGDKFKNSIIKDFKSIGYNISDIDIGELQSIIINSDNPSIQIVGLRIKEKDLKCMTDQNEMSTGMFRALSIIIHMNYYELERIPGCILIDDIGEGLDFDRSTRLIQLLIKKTENTKLDIQLIMTTNDRFVMNNVDLKYWQIIDRKGSNVRYFNLRNSPDVFENFKFTGLNNFDFFTSEYYKS